MGHVTMAQNAWDIPSSDSGKTQLSSSLDLESTAFPQRHPFCPLPEMKLVDLTELSSQVCEGLSLVTGKGTASSNSRFKTLRGGKEGGCQAETGTNQQTLWSNLL